MGYTIEDFEKPPKTSGNTTKVYKEESVTRSKSKSSIAKMEGEGEWKMQKQ